MIVAHEFIEIKLPVYSRTDLHMADVESEIGGLNDDVLTAIPRWAAVVIVVRAGLRFLPSYASDALEPGEQRMRVTNALRLAEKRAAIGGNFAFDDSLQLGDQYFDHYC